MGLTALQADGGVVQFYEASRLGDRWRIELSDISSPRDHPANVDGPPRPFIAAAYTAPIALEFFTLDPSPSCSFTIA